ncbi:MAG TPA: hypothetical protein VF529_02185 [Solirubrobacteraceae bacterium]
MIRCVLVLLALLCAAPASVAAHAVVSMDGPTILYSARDATSQSTVTVTAGATTVRLTDTTVDGGIDPGRCQPGDVDGNGYIIEVTCPRSSDTRIRLDVGLRDDSIEVRESTGALPVPAILLGGSGNDKLTGGGGPDQVDGGEGSDTLRGEGGDDQVIARDGAVEVVDCGAGADRAYVDPADLPDSSCETVERADPPPPPSEEPPPPAGEDTEPPTIDARARRRQRVGRSPALVATASANEVVQLSARATIRTRGRRLTLAAPQQRAATPGESVRLVLRGTASTARALRRALRGRRRVYAVVTVIAIDDAGNSAATRLERVRLTR